MIITLTGENDFLRSRELDTIVADFITEYTDMALERLDGEDNTSDRLQASLHSLPFLTFRKLVVLREPSKLKTFTEKITELLSDIPETTDVVFVEPKLDKRLNYYKTLKKQTDFREFYNLDANGLARWASGYVNSKAGNLSSSDARFLVDRVGMNQQTLHSELDKLMMYNSKITRQSILLLTERLPQSTIFELLNAAFTKNTAQALALYKEQRALREEPQKIIAMLAWQLHSLVVVKSYGDQNVSEIARKARMHPSTVLRSQGVVRNLALVQLKNMIIDLLQLDLRLKRTSIDADEALQAYLVNLDYLILTK